MMMPAPLVNVFELTGHGGCVNRASWRGDGLQLASTGDDTTVKLWDFGGCSPWRMTQTSTIPTGHSGNVFGVAYLTDAHIVTGAMDGEVRWHVSTDATWVSHLLHASGDRVKAVETADSPWVFWAAVEDGTVLQFDSRTVAPISARSRRNGSALISLRLSAGERAHVVEIKSVAVSPSNPNHLVVACSDPFVRLYDRRMLPPLPAGGLHTSPRDAHRNVLRYCPLHLAPDSTTYLGRSDVAEQLGPRLRLSRLSRTHVTHVEFDSSGRDLVAHYHREGVYVFDVLASDEGAPVERYGDGSQVVWDADGLDPAGSSGKGEAGASSVDHPARHLGTSISVFEGAPSTPAFPETALQSKDAGNAAFRAKEYLAAVRHYTLGIEAAVDARFYEGLMASRGGTSASSTADVVDQLAQLYCNRALALMKRASTDGQSDVTGSADAAAAVRDCEEALRLSPLYWKAALRLAQALKQCGQVTAALKCSKAFVARYGASPSTPPSALSPLEAAVEDARELIRSTTATLATEAAAPSGGGGSRQAPAFPADATAVGGVGGTEGATTTAGDGSRRSRWVRRTSSQPRGELDPDDNGDDPDDNGDESREVSEGGDDVWAELELAVQGLAAQPRVPSAAPSGAPSSDTASLLALPGSVTGGETASGAAASVLDPSDAAPLLRGPGLLRNPACSYPHTVIPGSLSAEDFLAQHRSQAQNSAESSGSSGVSRWAGPWQADPELLCSRHTVRCLGALNVQTDIKEAAFWEAGWEGRTEALQRVSRSLSLQRDASVPAPSSRGFIVAGSDFGKICVFDRSTGLLLALLDDDEDVTNVVRPHPTLPLLASAGIGTTVRLWAPQSIDTEDNEGEPLPSEAPTSPPPSSSAAAPSRRGPQPARRRMEADPARLDAEVQRHTTRAVTTAPGSILPLPQVLLQSLLRRGLRQGMGEEDGDGDGGGEEGAGDSERLQCGTM